MSKSTFFAKNSSNNQEEEKKIIVSDDGVDPMLAQVALDSLIVGVKSNG